MSVLFFTRRSVVSSKFKIPQFHIFQQQARQGISRVLRVTFPYMRVNIFNSAERRPIESTCTMARREDFKAQLTAYCSNSSLHPYPHFLHGGFLRRVFWVIMAIGFGLLLATAILFLIQDYKNHPKKMESFQSESYLGYAWSCTVSRQNDYCVYCFGA